LDEIKYYLVNPPVLVPPQKHKLDERPIGSVLIQEFEGKKELYIL
jgi:hypothetical protein